MSRKGSSLNLSLSTDEKEQLEKLAVQFGCTWGEKPNISGLLKSIASGNLAIHYADDLPKPEIRRRQAQSAIRKIQQGLDEFLSVLR